MRAMIKMAATAAVLLTAAPALAMTPVNSPSPAGLAAARYFSSRPALPSPISGLSLQAAVVGAGLRADGGLEFSGDGAVSYGYLTSAEPKEPAKTGVERYFEDDLPTYRTPGVTIHYATAPGVQVVATPQGK